MPGRRPPQVRHRLRGVAVHQAGPRQLGQRPRLSARVLGAAVQLQGRPQVRLRARDVAPAQVQLAELEVGPRLAVQRLARAVQHQRLGEQLQGLGQPGPVALDRRQRVQRPRPVRVQLGSGLQVQRLPELGRRVGQVALVVQRDPQRAQGTRRTGVVVGVPVQVDHGGQRRTRLVQLAQLPGRDAGAPLHRAHQQPLVHGLRQLADLPQPVQVAAQQAVVAQRAQQVQHRALVDALRVPQRRRDEARLVVQPAQRLVQGREAVLPELVGAGRHVAVDQAQYGVGQLGVVGDEPFLRGRPLAGFLLVGEAGAGEGAHHVVQAVAAAPDVVDQTRPRQGRQLPGGLRLVRAEQRGGGSGTQRGASRQRQPPQQPPGRLRLVGVAQPQRPLDRFHGTVGAQVGRQLAR
ncbi:hypothetical protein STENM223S_02218 [Streptomyces tendae]